jgi:hypothetical protein
MSEMLTKYLEPHWKFTAHRNMTEIALLGKFHQLVEKNTY